MAEAYLIDVETPVAEVQIRAWVGVLWMEAENLVVFPCPEDVTYRFGDDVVRFAEALVWLADDKFAFTTAESGLGGENMFKRMAAVEIGVSELRNMMREALKGGNPKASVHLCHIVWRRPHKTQHPSVSGTHRCLAGADENSLETSRISAACSGPVNLASNRTAGVDYTRGAWSKPFR